jgi:hypothetical protein
MRRNGRSRSPAAATRLKGALIVRIKLAHDPVCRISPVEDQAISSVGDHPIS